MVSGYAAGAESSEQSSHKAVKAVWQPTTTALIKQEVLYQVICLAETVTLQNRAHAVHCFCMLRDQAYPRA